MHNDDNHRHFHPIQEPADMKDFRNKVVVITGAGSGMGRAYAEAFAALGAKLALNDFDAIALEATASILGSRGHKDVLTQAFDVGDRTAMDEFAQSVQDRFGGAHVVINNAGIEGSAQPSWLTRQADYERIMRVNFFGVLNGTLAFLPQLQARQEGAIVNVSSIMGLIGSPSQTDYCASKFAVRGFTEALMVELHESPISVHLVHPGGVATNIARKPHSQAFAKRYLTTPPEEVARRVVRGIQKGQAKIICGQDAFKTWVGSNLLPHKWLTAIVWREIRPTLDKAAYMRAR